MIYVHALGTAQIDAGTARVTPRSARRFAMLLYLAAETGRKISRSTLHELICPKQDETSARHSLRQLVYKLRESDVPVVSDAYGVELVADAVRHDYAALVEQTQPADELLRAAAGGFLPGYTPTHSEAFSEWYDGYRARTLFDLSKALLRATTDAKVAADWARAECGARACLAIDPLNEAATLALAETLAMGGAKVRALELLDYYMKEAGGRSTDLRLPAAVLRARIQEHVAPDYSSGNPMPFVGRSQEMSTLHEELSRVRTGMKRLVVVTGEPGIGKTRLVEEFASFATLDGAVVETFTATSHDTNRPMAAFVDLVPKLLQVTGALGCSPTTLSTLSRLASHADSGSQHQLPHDIHSLAYSISKALEDLLDAITDETRLILAIEDAHWLDCHSLEAVGDLARRARGSGLMILVTSRDRHQLNKIDPELSGACVLALRGLEHSDAARLCGQGLSGADDSAVEMRDWIAEKAAGNPLFIRALSAHYRSSGREFEVPTDLLELVRRRTDSVSSNAMTALIACAALGRWCSLDRYARVLEMPHADLMRAVAELHDAELIRATPDGLAVAHPLITQALRNRDESVGAKLTHRQVARVLEAEPRFTTSPSMIWDCGQHWIAAGEPSRALTLLKLCANHALDIGRPGEAAQTLRHAASLTTDDGARGDLLREAALLARLGSEFDIVLECVSDLRSIEKLSRHDDIELCELEALAATFAETAQFQDRALCCLTSAESSIVHRVRASLMILKYCDNAGDPRLLQSVQNAIGAAELDSVSPTLRLEYRLVLHSIRGNFGLAIETAREIRETQLDSQSPMERAKLLYNAGLALWFSGRSRESIETLQVAYQVAAECGAVRLRLLAGLQMSGSLVDLGESERARERFREVEAFAKTVSGKHWPFELALIGVDIALARNDVKAAACLLQASETERYCKVSRRRTWHRAYALRIRHLGIGKPLNAHDVDELLMAKGSQAQIVGVRDLEIATAIEHIQKKDRERAREVAEHYLLSERSYLTPLGIHLQEALRSIDSEDLMNAWPLHLLAASHS